MERPHGDELRPAAEEPAASRTRAHPGRRRDQWTLLANRVVDWAFFVLYGILGMRFLLALLGAREDAGFTRFVRAVTEPFYGPFEGIVPRPEAGPGMLDFPVLVAILAYLVLHLALRGLLRVIATRMH